MLLWLRQQRKNPPTEGPVHPGWLWGFVGLLVVMVSFGMWIDAHLPQEAARRASMMRPEYAYEQGLSLALLLGLSASLLVRWRSQFGFFVRYGVYWLFLTGFFLLGYAAWFGLLF